MKQTSYLNATTVTNHAPKGQTVLPASFDIWWHSSATVEQLAGDQVAVQDHHFLKRFAIPPAEVAFVARPEMSAIGAHGAGKDGEVFGRQFHAS